MCRGRLIGFIASFFVTLRNDLRLKCYVDRNVYKDTQLLLYCYNRKCEWNGCVITKFISFNVKYRFYVVESKFSSNSGSLLRTSSFKFQSMRYNSRIQLWVITFTCFIKQHRIASYSNSKLICLITFISFHNEHSIWWVSLNGFLLYVYKSYS